MRLLNFTIRILVLCAVLSAISGTFAASDPLPRLVLPAVWQVQPATSPDTPPANDQWGQIDSSTGDWRWTSVVGQPPQWAKVDRSTVNSLWYQQTATIPVSWGGRRVVADFRRIEGDAIVVVNGQRVGELLRPGGEIDLTPFVKPGEANTLLVFMTRDYTGISRGFKDDPLRYEARALSSSPLTESHWPLGITAPVTLIPRATPVAISDIFIRPSWRTKSLSIDVTTSATEPVMGVTAVAEIVDVSGKQVLTVRGAPFDAPAGTSTHTATAAWANPIPWELDGGYLYTAHVSLKRADAPVDEYPDVKFGFREIWTQGRQIMMNGHPSRWRLGSLMEGGEGNPNAYSFFQKIGYNVFIYQDNPTAWWRDWDETPLWSEAALDEMDRRGLGVLMAAPSVNWPGMALLNDAATRAEFAREMSLYISRYRNHPCILAWTVGMNAYNPQSAISPQGMGRREQGKNPHVDVIEAGVKFAKAVDPTRLVYSHADGGEADISTANVYLNFAPLQEREDWPSAWAASGDMPAMAAEFGQPFTANFWKDKRSFFTEYAAIYLGDRAYTEETPAALQGVIAASIANTSNFGATDHIDFSQYPSYWDFQRLFVRNTNRAWRTWGVDGGWSYWSLDTGYGDPPGFKRGSNTFTRYRYIDAPVTAKPSWANPNFDIHSQANQPLLAYIAGEPVPTDKTHAFTAGELFRKDLAFVWDGPGSRTLSVTVASSGAKPLSAQPMTVVLHPGDIKLVPISFRADPAPQRVDGAITMTARDGNGVAATDSFPIEVFPRSAPLVTTRRIALFDPKGLSGPWIASLGLKAQPWKPGDSLAGIDLLIVGREAIRPGLPPLYTPQDIARGLKVLVLEQQPDVWKGMGFKITDTMPRYVFARDKASPILSGVEPVDLINWRGSPNLLPEGVTLQHDTLHAPKWTNRHAVASVALQIPEIVGFTPVLACEFDMNYTPLLQCRYGAGQVTLSTLDLTGRVGVDPDATQIARNLLREELTPEESASATTVGTAGDIGTAASDLGIDAQPMDSNAGGRVILAGNSVDPATYQKLTEFAQAGGAVIQLPTDQSALESLGFRTAPQSLYQAHGSDHPLMASVSPSLLRWRDHLDFTSFAASGQPAGSTVLADGLLLEQREGKGEWIGCQASPDLLSTRYATDPDRAEAIQTSVQRLRQLEAQVLTDAGIGTSRATIARLSHADLGPSYNSLGQWQELGPFPFEQDDGTAMLSTKFAGEDSAIAGDTNPNITYTRADGKALNWRQTVQSDTSGHVDLGSQVGQSGLAVAYFVKHVHSDHARAGILRLGVDYRIEIWLNGSPVFLTINGRAQPNSFQVQLPLQAGDNIITLKVGSGSKGFGFWADLSADEPQARTSSAEPLPSVSFYHPVTPDFDPYEFHYW